MFQNRDTIGKLFRRNKGLRKKDPKAIVPDTPPLLEEYMKKLQQQGLVVNKLRYALFETKNGLKYPGLIGEKCWRFLATDVIISNEILVEVPREMLLNTRDAFNSPLREMFLAYPQFFSNQFTSSWEDHMLLAFLLYEYQRGKESPHYHLIQNLPRDIDYLVFWDPREWDLLEDPTLVKQAKKQYSEFLVEYETLKLITEKYRYYFKEETVSFDNVKWIYTHLVTRCFGKYLAYVTMVPFCELFNHECVDVYYDFTYNNDNPYKSEESEWDPPTKLSQDDEQSLSSSDGSYNSEDEVSDSEFADGVFQAEEFDFDMHQEMQKGEFYDQFKKTFDIDHKPEESEEEYNLRIKDLQDSQIKMRKDFNIKQNLQREVYLLSKDVKMWMFQNLDYGDNFSIFLIGQMIAKLNKSLQEYLQGSKAYFMAREDMKRVQQTCSTYKTDVYNFMKDTLKKQVYSTSNFAQKRTHVTEAPLTAEQILSQSVDAETEYFKEEFNVDKFDRFIMKCSRKDQFEKGAQVYFCYGRLSNRMMLMRYGMALENNKYDHFHLRVDYTKYLQNQDAQALVYKYKLSRFKRFKLKFTTFPIDFIVFCKMVYWTFNVHSVSSIFFIQDLKLEQKGLQLALEILLARMQKFNTTIEQNTVQLYDRAQGYHQHFATIFRLERQRLLDHNIKQAGINKIRLMKICLKVLERMLEGIQYSVAILRVHDLETESEARMNRIILRKYFENMRYAMYLPQQ